METIVGSLLETDNRRGNRIVIGHYIFNKRLLGYARCRVSRIDRILDWQAQRIKRWTFIALAKALGFAT
jgi:hypothetical protein